jgi:hypothetical protein
VGKPDSVAEQASHSLGQVEGHLHNLVAGDVHTVERQRSLADLLEEDVGNFGQESHKHLGDFGMTLRKRTEKKRNNEKVTANVSK